MCPYCLAILGPYCRPHEEVKCPLKKASYCSTCGKGKHSQSECPQKVSITLNYIPSIKPVYDTIEFLITHNDIGYMRYLEMVEYKLSEISADSIDSNREIVREHLLTRGYTLVNPIIR